MASSVKGVATEVAAGAEAEANSLLGAVKSDFATISSELAASTASLGSMLSTAEGEAATSIKAAISSLDIAASNLSMSVASAFASATAHLKPSASANGVAGGALVQAAALGNLAFVGGAVVLANL